MIITVKPSSQYGKNMRHAFDATLKRKDRIDFYPCIADAPVDASDRTCHKFIADISCVINCTKSPRCMVMQPLAYTCIL